jgi:hypothetical protein
LLRWRNKNSPLDYFFGQASALQASGFDSLIAAIYRLKIKSPSFRMGFIIFKMI